MINEVNLKKGEPRREAERERKGRGSTEKGNIGSEG